MVVSTSRLEPVEGLVRPGEDLAQRPQFCRSRGGVDARFTIYAQNAAEWWCRRLDWSLSKGLLQLCEDLAEIQQICRAHGGVDARFGIYAQNAAEWWCRRLDVELFRAFCRMEASASSGPGDWSRTALCTATHENNPYAFLTRYACTQK